MYQFIESIRIQNGQASNLVLHTERLNWTRRAHFEQCSDIDLKQILYDRSHRPLQETMLREEMLFKCRIIYGEKIEKIEFHPYQIRPVRSLKLVYSDAIDYTYKTTDRTALHSLFQQKGRCDDIMMVKNDLLTDSYYANLVFETDGQFFTPHSPLLNGVRRQQLLQEGLVKKAEIRVQDLKAFEAVHLVNAMMDLKECVVIL